MVYDVDGNALSVIYDIDGNVSPVGYDVDGNLVHPSDPVGTLKVMSYNVLRWEGYNSQKAIQNVAFNYGADIIGMQEWGYTESKTIEGTNCISYLNGFGYDDVVVTTSDVNHKAIASKLALSDYSETVFNQSIETRSYTKCYVTAGGKRIAVFNTHTDYQLNSAVKFAQIQELLSAVANEPYFILFGDLNTTCTNESDTEYQNCVQPFIDAGYNVANSPVGSALIWTYYNGNTVAESTQITPPDNIITSANIAISNAETIGTKLSASGNYVVDHLPLVADLAIY